MIRNWKRAPSDRNQGQEIKNIERETNKDSKDTIITSKIAKRSVKGKLIRRRGTEITGHNSYYERKVK